MHHRSLLRATNLTSAAIGALASTILMLALSYAAPAQAQTYDPHYPVCLQTYGNDGGAIECLYSSLGQCQATASGRAAQCLENPYFARRPAQPPGRVVRQRRAQY